MKRELGIPVLVTLQGDDIFVDYLPEKWRTRALAEIRKLVDHVDGFLVHSRYYGNFMQDYFGIPSEKIHVVPLGIDVKGFPTVPPEHAYGSRPPTIGYLARLAKEKGLHVLVDAFILLHDRNQQLDARLRMAGWIGEDSRAYAEEQFQKLRDVGLEDKFEYCGINRSLGEDRLPPESRRLIGTNRLSRAERPVCSRGVGGRSAGR